MKLQTELHDLLDRLTIGLRQIPGVTALYLFGSLATPEADAFADIDLQLITADMALTRADWPAALAHIQPVVLTWPITPAADNTAFAVLFQGMSLYHKVDIGVSTADDSPMPSSSEAALCLWSQPPSHIALPQPECRAYTPAHGTIGHQLLDQLIAAVRYVKSRKRGQLFTCWRFMRSQPEKLLQLLYEQQHAWVSHTGGLTTWDYKKLARVCDAATQQEVMRHLNWSTPAQMDRNFYWFVERSIELYTQKAATHHEQLPYAIIDAHLTFLRTELALK
jgi:hypothetical protein